MLSRAPDAGCQMIDRDQALAELDGGPEPRLQPGHIVEEQAQLVVVHGLAEGVDAGPELLEAQHAGEAAVEVEGCRTHLDGDAARDGTAQALGDVGCKQAAATLGVRALQADAEEVEQGVGHRDIGVVTAELPLQGRLDDAHGLLADLRPAACEPDPDLVEVEQLQAAQGRARTVRQMSAAQAQHPVRELGML